ncbi:hypothetical protein [Candidatus Nitrosocosmicus hydrocola]|uniref:hypothetical protein n=1 Tax=Candidatus Nitrosocosmicus hydrocola TaxID=1826872 RepID=UPI0011E5E476|nr:hypothetical protein [Candidatus Nitrosocosmicus hydrocola]
MSELNDDYPIKDDSENIEDVICYGFGCCNYAIKQMPLKAGTFGVIDVFLCAKCLQIIRRKEEMFGEKGSLVDTLSPKLAKNQRQDRIQSPGDSIHV